MWMSVKMMTSSGGDLEDAVAVRKSRSPPWKNAKPLVPTADTLIVS